MTFLAESHGRIGTRLRRLLAIVSVLLAILPSYANPPDTDSRVAAELKVAYIYNFIKFVTWPEQDQVADNQPFVIAVVGTDSFGGALDRLKSKRVRGRPIELSYYKAHDRNLACDVLFICDSERKRVADIQKQLQRPTLTIADFDGFTDMGGMIELFFAQKRLRFKINVAATSKDGLKVSSKLLKLATVSGSK